MVFTDITFIFCLLPVFIAADFILKKSTRLRNGLLIVISLIFYCYDGSSNILILLGYGVFNYAYMQLIFHKSVIAVPPPFFY